MVPQITNLSQIGKSSMFISSENAGRFRLNSCYSAPLQQPVTKTRDGVPLKVGPKARTGELDPQRSVELKERTASEGKIEMALAGTAIIGEGA